VGAVKVVFKSIHKIKIVLFLNLFFFQLALSLGCTPQQNNSALTPNDKILPPEIKLNPLVVEKGGTYSGSWSFIQIKTTEPVVIKNSFVKGTGDDENILINCKKVWNVNLTLINTNIQGILANVLNSKYPTFLNSTGPVNLDVEHNSISKVSQGFLVSQFSVGLQGKGVLKLLYNSFLDIDGRISDGNNGYLASTVPTPHVVLFNGFLSTPNVEVGWNQIINNPYQSDLNDVINVYNSSGTVQSPIAIHDNFLDGSYTPDPTKITLTSNGIMTDGTKNSVPGYEVPSFVEIYHNTVLRTGGGIAIAAGHDISVHDNFIMGSGLLSTSSISNPGAQISTYGSGLAIWDYYLEGQLLFFNNTAKNNNVTWANFGKKNLFYFPSADATQTTGNIDLGPVTSTDEDSQLAKWSNSLKILNLSVGATP
jgi:hypothetical protein